MNCSCSRRPTRVAAVLLGAMLLAVSCSTTRGSLYSSSVSREEAAAAEARRRAEEKKRQAESASPGSPGPSQPAPFPVPSPSPANPPIPLTPPHGQDSASRLLLEIAKAATSGILKLDGIPEGARILIDGRELARGSGEDSAWSFRLGMGLHYLRVEAFGLEPWSGTVDIGGLLSQTSLFVSMKPAPFSIDSVSCSPRSLDPNAPGRLGRADIAFKATGRGLARVSVLAPSGLEIWSRDGIEIKGERCSVSWDGQGRNNRSLPPGEYRILVSATGTGGVESQGEGLVTLEGDTRVSGFSSLAGGASGGLYAPDARVLAEGHMELATGGYAVLDPRSEGAARAPLFAGLRFGFPGGQTELAATALGVFYPGYPSSVAPDSWTAGASLKTELVSDRGRALAFIFGGNYGSYFAGGDMPSVWDGPARFRGLYTGLILEKDSALSRVFLSPQILVSDYYPDYDLAKVPGFYAWSYLRGGLEILLPGFLGSSATLGLSAAARTAPFSAGLSFSLPLSVGAELHWYLPNSAQVLSLYASGEWASRGNYYVGGGLGFGFLF